MAIIFRMGFFLLEEVMMHGYYWTHVVFGLFLIYTGIKSATISDENFDPRESAVFIFLCKYIRLVNTYDDNGHLFVLAKVDPVTGETIQPDEKQPPAKGKEADLETAKLLAKTTEGYGTKGVSSTEQETAGEYHWHGTLLVLVV